MEPGGERGGTGAETGIESRSNVLIELQKHQKDKISTLKIILMPLSIHYAIN